MAENDSTKDYNESVRANLPAGMTYNSDINRYVVNGKNWFSYKLANWYLVYIIKFGYSVGPVIPAGAIQERDGDYILDRSGNYIEVRT